MSKSKAISSNDIINEILKEYSLDDIQVKALKNAFDFDFSLISGYAGSGKSFLIKIIEKYLKVLGWNVVKVAPTGRAALRIYGKTIHSWLLPNIIISSDNPDDFKIDGFKRKSFHDDFGKGTKVCLLVDESSMIDSELNDLIMNCFNKSLNAKQITKLIFVGDSAQLEPVGEGNPFINFLQDDSLPMVFLEKIYRSESTNDIPLFANQVRTNGMPYKINEYSDVKLISKDLAISRVSNDPKIQIIAPYNSMCLEINLAIQTLRKIEAKIHSNISLVLESWDPKIYKYVKTYPIYGGDKVLITKNHLSGEVMNGTTAFFDSIVNIDEMGVSREYAKLIEETSNKEVFVPLNWFQRNTTLGYAITVHKAQGSQWDEVMYMPSYGLSNMGDPIRMHYTAVSRAAKALKIISKTHKDEVVKEEPKQVEIVKSVEASKPIETIKVTKDKFSQEFLDFLKMKNENNPKVINEEKVVKVNSSKVNAKLELLEFIKTKYPKEANLLSKERYASVREFVFDKYPDKVLATEKKYKIK